MPTELLCLLSLLQLYLHAYLQSIYYGQLQSTTVTCTLPWLLVVCCDYLQFTKATCSLLWLAVVYYGYLQSTMATYSLLCLPAVYYYSHVQLPVVYYGYTYSFPSALPSLLNTVTLLCLPSLHYNSLCAAQCALPTQLTCAIVCSAYPQLYTLSALYMTIQSAVPKQSSKLHIAFYALLVSFNNNTSILSNRTYRTEFVVPSHARCNKIRQC